MHDVRAVLRERGPHGRGGHAHGQRVDDGEVHGGDADDGDVGGAGHLVGAGTRRDDHRAVTAAPEVGDHLEHGVGDAVDGGEEGLGDDGDAHERTVPGPGAPSADDDVSPVPTPTQHWARPSAAPVVGGIAESHRPSATGRTMQNPTACRPRSLRRGDHGGSRSCPPLGWSGEPRVLTGVADCRLLDISGGHRAAAGPSVLPGRGRAGREDRGRRPLPAPPRRVGPRPPGRRPPEFGPRLRLPARRDVPRRRRPPPRPGDDRRRPARDPDRAREPVVPPPGRHLPRARGHRPVPRPRLGHPDHGQHPRGRPSRRSRGARRLRRRRPRGRRPRRAAAREGEGRLGLLGRPDPARDRARRPRRHRRARPVPARSAC